MASYDRTNPPESTHSKYSFSLKSKIAALGVFLMLKIVKLNKIETQLRYNFQMIIGWPIFWIYYKVVIGQGRASRSS